MLDIDSLIDYWPRLIGMARKTLPYASDEVWEDVAATTIEKAIKGAARFDDSRGRPTAWLLTIARRTALDYHDRAIARETALVETGRARIDAGSETHLTTIAVREAVEHLPPFLAPYASARLAGLGIIDAGEAAGLPRATASRREQELRAQLKILLGGAA
jgi:RNA polymerase sigma factor (sigma-70 family)